jgi:hypothetical protein
VYSRERSKYKLPNDREIFLYNFENVEKMMAQGNRRRYKSSISSDNPFYKGVVLPPGLRTKAPIKLPKYSKNMEDTYSNLNLSFLLIFSDQPQDLDDLSDEELMQLAH